MYLFALIFYACAALLARSDDAYPKPDWRDAPDPLASPHAEPGGMIRFAAFQPPKSLNAYIDNNTYTRQVFGMMYETLLGVDSSTTEFVPHLARRWTISDDKLTYTFELDEAAVWSDGRPVTAEDVKWTFDQVMDPRHATGASKVMLGVFDSPQIVGPRMIRFRAKESHWRNLSALGLFEILPRHAFEGQDFNRLDLDRPVVSGPYVLSAVKEQIEIRLRRRRDWWAGSKPSLRNTMNFDTIVFRYFSSNENAFEAFKKGLVDVYAVYTARIWANETIGEKFDKNWIVKRRVKNHNPIGFQGFAMNMRRPPFDDLRVRRVLAVKEIRGNHVTHARNLGQLVTDFGDRQIEVLRADEKDVVGRPFPHRPQEPRYQLDEAAGLLELLVLLEQRDDVLEAGVEWVGRGDLFRYGLGAPAGGVRP